MAEKVYLICDCVGSTDLEILTEARTSDGLGGMVIRGKFQEADSQNKNRRVYPLSVLKPQVEALQEAIRENRLVGELDHPSDSVIHFENASHQITRLYWEGNQLMGEARVLNNTPSGKILEALLRAGVRIGISSRGVGSGCLTPEGVTVINDGFRLITFDIVADPSTPGAYLNLNPLPSMVAKESRVEPTTKKDKTGEPPRDEPPAPYQKTEETQEESASTRVDRVESELLKPEVVSGWLKNLFEIKRIQK